jgi:aminoglycoside/choline kinase family phosphotransferase
MSSLDDSLDDLLCKTRTTLSGFAAQSLHPIERGGSSRRFFRVHSEGEASVILVHDLGEKEENKHYASLAGFLAGHGVPVPEVLAVDHDEGLLWLEDLGEKDLWASRNESWDERRPLYESVLRGISVLHRIPVDDVDALHLQKEFDERLYRWEQEYFAEHCLGGIFGIDESVRSALLGGASMKELARSLAAEPRQLVHRDFQSQNIMIRDGGACFIDFQGMRPGLLQYDLASLLCDPYVEIAPEERSYLLSYYNQLPGAPDSFSPAKSERIFWKCAVQRLMQALGAYGFLSLHCGKPAFRTHVTPALRKLREALGHLHPEDRLDELVGVLKDLKPES